MTTTHRILISALALVLWVGAAADELPEVSGIIGLEPVEAGSCIGVYVPMGEGTALSGVVWYNNDHTVLFPELLVASGVAGAPEPAAAAYVVVTNISGVSSGWSEVMFTEPIAATSDGFYVVFRLPEGSEHVANGAGGGAGIGYTAAANGHTGWLSLDGEEWCKLHDDFGMAIVPVTVAAEEGMTEKSLDGEEETPVTHTALLLPSPNPFNPQTELRYQLRKPAHVDLAIYNVRGERIKTLVSEHRVVGRYTAVWSGADDGGRRQSSGVYFARFTADHVVQTQRLLLVK